MIGRTCGAAGETKSSERGRICFVCFGVLRLPSQLRAALGSKANISLNTLRVQETPGLPAAFEATWPAAGVKRGSCEQQFDRCSRCLSPFPDAAPHCRPLRALRSSSSGRAIGLRYVRQRHRTGASALQRAFHVETTTRQVTRLENAGMILAQRLASTRCLYLSYGKILAEDGPFCTRGN